MPFWGHAWYFGVTHPLAKPAKHLHAVNAFATVKAVNTLEQLRFQFLKGLGRLGQARGLVFLETTETGADNFTGSLITAPGFGP
jgi:hypothetical protein